MFATPGLLDMDAACSCHRGFCNPGSSLALATCAHATLMRSRRTAQRLFKLLHHACLTRVATMLHSNRPAHSVHASAAQKNEFVRPGFELGYRKGKQYYVNNHLVFNVLVYLTHGEYTAARDSYAKSVALDALDNRHRRLMVLRSDGAVAADSHAHAQPGAFGGLAAAFEGALASVRRRLLADSGTAAVGGEEEEEDEPYYMVVGFEVSPCSIERQPGKEIEDIVCGVDNDDHITPQEIKEGADIVYTYDVYWQDSKIKWASRWDAYLRMPGGKVREGRGRDCKGRPMACPAATMSAADANRFQQAKLRT